MERRKAQRLNAHVPIRYSFYLNKRAMSSPIAADNISGTGLGVTLKEPAAKGVKLKVLIYFSDDQRPIASTSRVMWCKKIPKKEGNLFKIGMRHVRIDTKDKDRFVFLFCETMLNYFMAPSRKRAL
jgi:hypothetical protein